MGFSLGKLAAWGAVPWTGGGSLALYNNLKGGGKGDPGAPAPRPPLLASDVKLQNPLKGPLGDLQTNAQWGLEQALGAAQNQTRAGQLASGRTTHGNYTDQALGRANTAASSHINDTLANILGDTSLKYTQNQLGYNDNLNLASRIGALNSPSQLQEILSGLGGGADALLKSKSLYDALNAGKSSGVTSAPNYGYYNSGGSGLNLYGY